MNRTYLKHNEIILLNLYLIYMFLFFLFMNVSAQDYSTDETDQTKLRSLMNIGTEQKGLANITQISNTLTMAVDENKYYIDAGDVFILKIDVKGPSYKLFNSVVTPDGYLVLPEAPSIHIKDLILKEAKEKILINLKKSFPGAQIEAYLYQLHPVNVGIMGCVPTPGKYQLLSNNRLSDGIDLSILSFKPDSLHIFNFDRISYRNVILKRNDQQKTYDLLRYKLTGDLEQNPYLMEDDFIFVGYKDTLSHNISVEGGVAVPLNFEFQQGDRLIDALNFAGGLISSTDSTRIELDRFELKSNMFSNQTLKYPEDSSFALYPDDRIFVRNKYNYHNKFMIEIKGEVKYPGFYAIDEGKTKLTELIERAGGFSSRASLSNAKILRLKDKIDDKELKRLSKITTDKMSKIEMSYFRLRTREDVMLVSCDFEKLFRQNYLKEDVVLYDKDVLLIPSSSNTVFVSGGVMAPGNVIYEAERNYLDYISLAGGFNNRARRGAVKIIKIKSGVWLDADKEIHLEEGDVVFIPEKEDVNWYEIVKDVITVAAQVATIVYIIQTTK
jgi:protein involved in polysaccharide export with SLBB domain